MWTRRVLLLLLLAYRARTRDVDALDAELRLSNSHVEELNAAERQLYGPLSARDLLSGVSRLQSLAEGGQSEAQARALFVLGAVAHTGVLPPGVLGWNRTALRRAVPSLPETRLHMADRFVWRKELCSYGVSRFLQGAAEDLLRTAEMELHHPEVPQAPLRLRDRARDGSWRRATSEEEEAEEDGASADTAEAQRNLGFKELVVNGDNAAAAQAFQAAAAAGDAHALFNLGYMHMRGLMPHEGGPDFVEAERLLLMAAGKQVGAAFNSLGVLAYNGHGRAPNMSLASQMFEKGGALGDPDSLYNTGLLVAEGKLEGDPEAAAESLTAASDAGHWRAPHTLAMMHLDGRHPNSSCLRAAQLLYTWVEERSGWSAMVDDAIAAFDDGDVQGALVQLSLLAAQGCDAAGANIAYVLLRRRGGLTPWLTKDEAVNRAVALLHDSAQRDYLADATVDLGSISLERGDWQSAMQYWSHADSSEALVNLALMHLRRQDGSTGLNITHARQLLERAFDIAPYDEDLAPVTVLLTAVRILTWADILCKSRVGVIAATVLLAVLIAHAGHRRRISRR